MDHRYFYSSIGPNGTRSISSDSAFLFNINNALELKPFKLNIKKSHKQIAALYDPTTGPVFGQDDLRVTFDNRSIPLYGASHIGHAYELPQGFNGTDQVDGMKLFAGTSIFSWDDLEVFYYDGESFVLLTSYVCRKRLINGKVIQLLNSAD